MRQDNTTTRRTTTAEEEATTTQYNIQYTPNAEQLQQNPRKLKKNTHREGERVRESERQHSAMK